MTTTKPLTREEFFEVLLLHVNACDEAGARRDRDSILNQCNILWEWVESYRREGQKEALEDLWNEVVEENHAGSAKGLELPILLAGKVKEKLKELSNPKGK